MTLPKSLTTVTTFSKILALVLFITLPIFGFWLGMEYQKITEPVTSPIDISSEPVSTPTPTVDETANWKTYRNEEYGFEFEYPGNWTGNWILTSPDELIQFSINIDSYGDYGLSWCRHTDELSKDILLDLIPVTRFVIPYCDIQSSDPPLTDQQCAMQKTCSYTVGVNVCLDKNHSLITKDQEDFEKNIGCFGQSRYDENNTYYQIVMDCKNETLGTDGLHKCTDLFDQILSTFKFIEINESTELREVTLPVTEIETEYGIDQTTPFVYPKTITLSIQSEYQNMLQAYGGGDTVVIAPKNWTGSAQVGADGNTFIDLHPIQNNNDASRIKVSLTHSGVGAYEAGLYFPWIREHWSEVAALPLVPAPPSELTSNFINQNTNQYSLADTPEGLEVNGIIFANIQTYKQDGSLFARRMEIVLSAQQHNLALFLLDNFINREEP